MAVRRTLAALLVCAGACGGGEQAASRAQPASTRAAAPPIVAGSLVAGLEARSFDAVHRELTEEAKKSGAVARKNGRSAIVYGRAAAAFMRIARVSGDYDDLAQAEEMLEAAFSRPNSTPPYFLRARFHFTCHRFDTAARDFEQHLAQPRLRSDDKTGAGEELFAGQLAFERGDYPEALRRYEKALSLHATPQAWSARAHYAWKTADFETAESSFLEALGLYGDRPGEPAAWLHLQRGQVALARGRFDDALHHYEAANDRLPGYWLIDEHVAEVLVLLGKPDDAYARYVDLVRETRKPEFMDALSDLEELRGDSEAAARLRERARKRYEAQMEQFPEATYGHALRHYLAYGPVKKALKVAGNNHEIRPNAEAKVLLARAELGAGNTDAAASSIEQALATPMRTSELHRVAAATYAAAGREDLATSHRDRARLLDPTGLAP